MLHGQVVPELAEPFAPLPDDLLVNLKESRGVIDALLDSLPTAFSHTGTVRPCAISCRCWYLSCFTTSEQPPLCPISHQQTSTSSNCSNTPVSQSSA